MNHNACLKNIQSSVFNTAGISNVSIGPRTGLVYAIGDLEKKFSLWSIGNNEPCAEFGPLGSYVTSSQFDNTEELIVCGTNGGSTIVYDIASEKSLCKWSANKSCIHSICIDPSNSDNIVTASQDGKVQLFAQKCHAPIRTYIAGQKAVKCVAFSNDGIYIACGGDDKVVSVYDIRNSGVLSFHELHNDSISALQFHPTEPIIISGGSDRALHFFDFNRNEEIEPTIPNNTAEIKAIRFTQKDDVAIALSSQLLSVVGTNPPQMYDRFNFSIGSVQDMRVINGNVVIASTMKDRVMFNRVKLDKLVPFSPYKKKSRDLSRRASIPHSSPQKVDETKLLLELRKERAPYCTEMNERCSRLSRLSEMLAASGVEKTIETVSEGSDLCRELATACLSRIKSIKLESIEPLFRVAQSLMYEDPEVALSLVDSLLTQYGKTLFATMRTNGSSPDLQERREKCDKIIYSYANIVPDIQNIANEKGPLGKTAKEILDEWRKLLA